MKVENTPILVLLILTACATGNQTQVVTANVSSSMTGPVTNTIGPAISSPQTTTSVPISVELPNGLAATALGLTSGAKVNATNDSLSNVENALKNSGLSQAEMDKINEELDKCKQNIQTCAFVSQPQN